MIRHRTFIQRKADAGVVSRCGSNVEILALETELTTRAMKGAKMGDG